jgi:transcriptional regulator with XRE-family HTH domain
MENTLRHRLRQLRKARGWTLKETEEKSSVPLSYLGAIENGRRRGGRDTLHKLATAFAGSPEETKKLLSEFEECQNPRSGMTVISSEFTTFITPVLLRPDDTKISSFDIANEIEQLLLVLGGCTPHQMIHEVLAKTDREISPEGNRMSRGYVVKHEDSEFLIEISVSRKKPS